MKKVIDLDGQRFGRLVVLERMPNKTIGNTIWKCRCDCGNESIVQGGNLRGGKVQSCGCLQREAVTKHGMEATPTYNAWASMKSRCNNPQNKFYQDYGGRGIKYCPQWEKFEQFLADVGEKPEGLWLERVDNNLGYEPSNCKWATPTEQRRNTRVNKYYEFRESSKTATAWAEKLQIPVETIRSRLNLGWSIEDAFTKPIDKRKSTKRKS